MNTMNDSLGTNNITTSTWDDLTITSADLLSVNSPVTTWASHGISLGVESEKSLMVSGNAKISGNLEVDGDLTISNASLSERLDKMEARLGILTVRPGLEERWQQLRELGEQYRQLEAELIERDWIFEQLKK